MEVLMTPNGLTVRELKQLVKDLPEENKLGDPYTVWVETSNGCTNEVVEIWPLNSRLEGCDLCLTTRGNE